MIRASLLVGLLSFTASLTIKSIAAPPTAEGANIPESSASADSSETKGEHDARMAWWRDAKFGLFIHWGIYAVPARKSEWVMYNEKIPVADYKKFARDFNPVQYDPAFWVRLAVDAGMKYMVITAKHHDGFALFPSKVTTWDIEDATPYKKDLLRPLAEAARTQGLKFGLYYSQAQDWSHPGGFKKGFPAGEGWDEEQKGDFDAYLENIAIPQTQEIIDRYRPDILWWDTPMGMTTQRAKPLEAIARRLPDIITNNRLGQGQPGDLLTAEQFVPVTGYPGDWETCMTMGRSWGYITMDEEGLKPASELIRKLASICSKGGNFLLNIGPKPDGTIPQAMVDRLREVGHWLQANGVSIYATTAGPFSRLSWGCATRQGDTLYLHIFKWPEGGKLRVPLKNKATGAWLLTDPADKLAVTKDGDRLIIQLPSVTNDPVNAVVVLKIEGEPEVPPLPTRGATAIASSELPGNAVANIFDGFHAKSWFASEMSREAIIDIELPEVATVAGYGFDEPDVWPRMKQNFTIEAEVDGSWRKIAKGQTKGHGQADDISPIIAKKFRLAISCTQRNPGIAEFQLYRPE